MHTSNWRSLRNDAGLSLIQIMAITLFELDEHPGRVAVTEVDGLVEDGLFFLDFARPLETKRRFGLMLEAVFAPVIHQGEREGSYVVGVHRSEPAFERVRALWKTHYPTPSPTPAVEVDGLNVIADCGRQFPSHCQ